MKVVVFAWKEQRSNLNGVYTVVDACRGKIGRGQHKLQLPQNVLLRGPHI
jgi:hypothetical protein